MTAPALRATGATALAGGAVVLVGWGLLPWVSFETPDAVTRMTGAGGGPLWPAIVGAAAVIFGIAALVERRIARLEGPGLITAGLAVLGLGWLELGELNAVIHEALFFGSRGSIGAGIPAMNAGGGLLLAAGMVVVISRRRGVGGAGDRAATGQR